MIELLTKVGGSGPAGDLIEGLFGPHRRLYKRLAQYSVYDTDSTAMFAQLARRPYPWLAACAQQFAQEASTALGRIIAPHEILFDAPPVEREVDFNIEVYFPKHNEYRPLGSVSPVVRALGSQFDDYVKRVRIFAHPRVVEDLKGLPQLSELLQRAIEKTGE
jgi:hypothetical protein